MEKGTPSRTSEYTAILRALHQSVDDDPKILADPIAPAMVDICSDTYLRMFDERDQPSVKGPRSVIVMRSRYAEDCLAESVRGGTSQYLILGAGFDTFAYRQPLWARNLQIYEVDHPSTQQWKEERLAAAGIRAPANLIFTPVDFEAMSLLDGLLRYGFDLAKQTFCSWLGVIMYLNQDAISKTLEFMVGLPTGSEMVFDYFVPIEALSEEDASLSRTEAERFGRMGEMVMSRFTPVELERMLLARKFSKVVHFSVDDGVERYFKGRRDGLGTRPTTRRAQLMRAIV